MEVPKKLVFYLKKNIQMPQTEPSSHNPKRHHDGHSWVLVNFGIPICGLSISKGSIEKPPTVKGYGHWKPRQSKNYMKANKHIFWRELPFSVCSLSRIIYIYNIHMYIYIYLYMYMYMFIIFIAKFAVCTTNLLKKSDWFDRHLNQVSPVQS